MTDQLHPVAAPEALDREAARLLHELRPLADTTALQARVAARLRGELPLAGRPWWVGTPRPTTWILGLGLAAITGGMVGALVMGGGASDAGAPPAPANVPAASVPADVRPAPEVSLPATSAGAAPSAVVSDEARLVSDEAADAPARPRPASAETPASLLYQAATALRRDGSPSRALTLLDAYAKISPDRGGSEEARALRLEAHYRMGSPATRALAEAYLRDFPAGRFRATAANILARGAARPGASAP